MTTDTTIAVSSDIADRLHRRKALHERGTSYNDVIRHLLEQTETADAPTTTLLQ